MVIENDVIIQETRMKVLLLCGGNKLVRSKIMIDIELFSLSKAIKFRRAYEKVGRYKQLSTYLPTLSTLRMETYLQFKCE